MGRMFCGDCDAGSALLGASLDISPTERALSLLPGGDATISRRARVVFLPQPYLPTDWLTFRLTAGALGVSREPHVLGATSQHGL